MRLRRRRVPAPALVMQREDGEWLHTVPAAVATELRYLVARLELEGKLGVPTRIGVIAALGGEGVTTLCRSLACVLALDHLERSVCIVDLNWWSPAPGASSGPGVAGVLRGEVDLDQAVVPTETPRLAHLPSGEVDPANRPALASSRGLHDLLEQLSGRYDHLLLDLPPVFGASESLLLAAHATATLLVVRAGATSARDARDVSEALRPLDLLGVVLNRHDDSTPDTILRHVAPPSPLAPDGPR